MFFEAKAWRWRYYKIKKCLILLKFESVRKTLEWRAEQRKVFGQEKWVARIYHTTNYDLQDVIGEVASRASAQQSEVEGVILAYLHQIKFYVSNGRSVNIDGVGTFYPNLSTKLVPTPEEATPKNCVKSITVGFRPATKLREKIRESVLSERKTAPSVYKKKEE